MTARDTSTKSPQSAMPTEGERVAKALARAGVASRREVERLIEDGRVALNGTILTTPAVKVGPGDILTVNGKVVGEAEAARVWRYHKPVGLVTTHSDPKGRPTVFAALPPGLPRVISIGRLDLNSEGLLLLTNDGELARALELPDTGLRRRYRARARGHVTQAKLDTLKDGITIEGVRYGGIEAKLDKVKDGEAHLGANLWITVTLAEGKNREVRRVLEALNLTVNRLIRLAYGPFQLGDIALGAVEEVGPRVIREQLAQWIAPGKLPMGNSVAKPVVEAAAAPARGRRPGGPHPGGPSAKPAKAGDLVAKPYRKPGAKPVAKAGVAAAEPAKVYKSGWAKPKIKPRIAPKPGGKSRPPRK